MSGHFERTAEVPLSNMLNPHRLTSGFAMTWGAPCLPPYTAGIGPNTLPTSLKRTEPSRGKMNIMTEKNFDPLFKPSFVRD